jgi:hypothetical protein
MPTMQILNHDIYSIQIIDFPFPGVDFISQSLPISMRLSFETFVQFFCNPTAKNPIELIESNNAGYLIYK